MRRVHGVSIGALHTSYLNEQFALKDCHTKAQAADLFAKHFVDKYTWEHDLLLIGILREGPTLNYLLKK